MNSKEKSKQFCLALFAFVLHFRSHLADFGAHSFRSVVHMSFVKFLVRVIVIAQSLKKGTREMKRER